MNILEASSTHSLCAQCRANKASKDASVRNENDFMFQLWMKALAFLNRAKNLKPNLSCGYMGLRTIRLLRIHFPATNPLRLSQFALLPKTFSRNYQIPRHPTCLLAHDPLSSSPTSIFAPWEGTRTIYFNLSTFFIAPWKDFLTVEDVQYLRDLACGHASFHRFHDNGINTGTNACWILEAGF